MKTTKRLLTVFTACALFSFTLVADAQIGRLGNGGGLGGGIGARLGGRAQQQRANEAELRAELEAAQQNANAVVATPAAQPAAQTAPAARQTLGSTRTINNPTPTPAAQTATSGAAQTPAKRSDGSEFVISEKATPAELVAQAQSLFTSEVSFETEEEYGEWVAKMLETVGKIADRILSLNPDDENFIAAVSLKGQVLCYQASIDSSVLPRLKTYADALAKHSRVQSLKEGRDAALAFKGVYLQAKVADIAEKNGTAQELTAAMQEVGAFIKEHPETSDMTVDLVYPVAVVAANVGDEQLPTRVWNFIRKILTASDTEESRAALTMLDGAIRYSELQGKPFEWKGCDVDGKPLDKSLVEGRVVLVLFWAAWCQPAPTMHAQLAELYKTYHEGGFEVLNYNLDAKMEDMREYMKKNAVVGLTLSDRATVDAKETSLAAYYGISEIPTMILVGGDGNVAAVDISMESLAATLQNVFKKPAPKLPGLETQPAATQTTATSSAATSGARTALPGRATSATGTATPRNRN